MRQYLARQLLGRDNGLEAEIRLNISSNPYAANIIEADDTGIVVRQRTETHIIPWTSIARIVVRDAKA